MAQKGLPVKGQGKTVRAILKLPHSSLPIICNQDPVLFIVPVVLRLRFHLGGDRFEDRLDMQAQQQARNARQKRRDLRHQIDHEAKGDELRRHR